MFVFVGMASPVRAATLYENAVSDEGFTQGTDHHEGLSMTGTAAHLRAWVYCSAGGAISGGANGGVAYTWTNAYSAVGTWEADAQTLSTGWGWITYSLTSGSGNLSTVARVFYNLGSQDNSGGTQATCTQFGRSTSDVFQGQSNAAGSGKDLTFGLADSGGFTPSGPVISAVDVVEGGTFADFTWTTDVAATTKVCLSNSTMSSGCSGAFYTSSDLTLVTSHEKLDAGASTPLVGDTVYHYRLCSKDVDDNETCTDDDTFTTLSDDTTFTPTTTPNRLANGNKLRVAKANAVGSCPPGDDPPQDGSCVWYWRVMTDVPTPSVTLGGMVEWEMYADDGTTLLCDDNENLSGMTDAYKGALFSPLVSGCPSFTPSTFYKWRARAKTSTAADFGDWSSLARVEIVSNDYHLAFNEQENDGYITGDGSVKGTKPTCAVLRFLEGGDAQDEDGVGCLWQWVGFVLDPSEGDWSAFSKLVIDPEHPTSDLGHAWPFSYGTTIKGAFTTAFEQEPECPFGTVTFPAFGPVGGCDGVSDIVEPIRESTRFQNGVKALASGLIIALIIYVIGWLVFKRRG